MKTLNERIQDLRNILVTCYNTIKRKGGTIPDVGERNMSNLPDAVRSIPQEHTELTELTVTANGEYLPADYDADGFSKVTARFDTSSLPKVKVASFKVTNECINEDGVWDGATLIDTSILTDIRQLFQNLKTLKYVDVSNWDTSNNTTLYYTFSNSGLEDIDVSNWDVGKVTSLECAFQGTKIKTLNANNWNVGKVTTLFSCFLNCIFLEHLDLSNWRFDNPINLQRAFKNCTSLKYANLKNFSATDAWEMFDNCTSLEEVDVSNWNTSKLVKAEVLFRDCVALKKLDLTNWDATMITSVGNMFKGCNSLTTLVGDRTIEDVLRDEIKILNGLIKTGDFINFAPNVNRASLRALINGLADLTGQTAQTLTIGAVNTAKLTEEDIAIAVNKNWTIV